MRAQSAVEIARASLVLAFPDATDEGLTKAAELIVRWGSEGVGARLDPQLAERMLLDLMAITDQDPERVPREDFEHPRPAPTRLWTRTEETENLRIPPASPRG